MKYRIDPQNPKTAYLQLYEQLREDIVKGLYPYGAKLPSKRILSEEAGVSVITVEHAYALLCDEGYAISRQRSGFFISFRENQSFSAPEKIVLPQRTPSAHVSRPEEFPFSVFAKTMRRVLSDYGEEILVKSPNRGNERLRDALSRYLARSRGIHASSDQIVIGAGAEYFYGILVETLGRDRCYAIESPSYEKIEKVYRAEGARIESLPLAQDGISSQALQQSRGDVLHITPYRSFPSGVTATASKKMEYLRWSEQGDRFLIEDDFESEFTPSKKPEETLFSMAKRENVFYINTFSKTIAPSIRVGYLVLPRRMLSLFEEKVGFYSCTVPTFEQLVLASFLESGDFERHINRVRRKKRRETKE